MADYFKKTKKKLGEDFFASKKKSKDKKRKHVKLSSYTFEKNIPFVRVGLASGLDQFSMSCGGAFIVSDGTNTFNGLANKFYTVFFDGKNIKLKSRNDLKLKKEFSGPISLVSSASSDRQYPFYVLDVSYGEDSFWEKKIDRAYRGHFEVLIKNNKLVLVNVVSTEEYLYGVLSAEIPASSPEAALSAQAVAARTLAYKNKGRHAKSGFDFCADVHCQVYQGLSAETISTIEAVDRTRGLVLFYKDKPIESFYHSNSGGCLAADVFGKAPYLEEKIDSDQGDLPISLDEGERWLIEEPDTFSTRGNKSTFRWQRIYDSEDFLLTFGFELKDLDSIMVRDVGDCFHNKAIDLVTREKAYSLNGDLDIRKFFGGLRSSAFKAMLKKSYGNKSPKLFLWGAGFGHGAGMSQEGAILMATEGYDYQKILKHYYSRTVLKKIYD